MFQILELGDLKRGCRKAKAARGTYKELLSYLEGIFFLGSSYIQTLLKLEASHCLQTSLENLAEMRLLFQRHVILSEIALYG